MGWVTAASHGYPQAASASAHPATASNPYHLAGTKLTGPVIPAMGFPEGIQEFRKVLSLARNYNDASGMACFRVDGDLGTLNFSPIKRSNRERGRLWKRDFLHRILHTLEVGMENLWPFHKLQFHFIQLMDTLGFGIITD